MSADNETRGIVNPPESSYEHLAGDNFFEAMERYKSPADKRLQAEAEAGRGPDLDEALRVVREAWREQCAVTSGVHPANVARMDVKMRIMFAAAEPAGGADDCGTEDVWKCQCGAPNHRDNQKCWKCETEPPAAEPAGHAERIVYPPDVLRGLATGIEELIVASAHPDRAHETLPLWPVTEILRNLAAAEPAGEPQRIVNPPDTVREALGYFVDCQHWRAFLHETDCTDRDGDGVHPDDRTCTCGGIYRIERVEAATAAEPVGDPQHVIGAWQPEAKAAAEPAGEPPDVVSERLAVDIGKVLDELASVVDVAADGPRLEIMEHVDAIAAISTGTPVVDERRM